MRTYTLMPTENTTVDAMIAAIEALVKKKKLELEWGGEKRRSSLIPSVSVWMTPKLAELVGKMPEVGLIESPPTPIFFRVINP